MPRVIVHRADCRSPLQPDIRSISGFEEGVEYVGKTRSNCESQAVCGGWTERKMITSTETIRQISQGHLVHGRSPNVRRAD